MATGEAQLRCAGVAFTRCIFRGDAGGIFGGVSCRRCRRPVGCLGGVCVSCIAWLPGDTALLLPMLLPQYGTVATIRCCCRDTALLLLGDTALLLTMLLPLLIPALGALL